MMWGREAEVAELAGLVRTATPIVLVGSAGVGKTSLARAALGEVGPFGEAGGLATLRWAPMLAFRRLLGSAISDEPAEVASQVLKTNPGGLLLDDVQWVDDLTLAIIGQLVGRVALVATVRSSDLDAPRAVECLGLVGFEITEVRPLGSEASGNVVDTTAPLLSRERRSEVLVLAAGNPLMLTELAASDHDSPTLLQVLLDRMADLSGEARLAMERLSVLGRPVERRLLGVGAPELVESGLVIATDGLIRVRHDLLAEVVVEDLNARADTIRRDLAEDVGPAEGAFLLAAAGERKAARRLALAAAIAVAKEGKGTKDGASGTSTEADRAELLCLAVTQAAGGDLDVENRIAAARALTWSGRPERALVMATPVGLDRLTPVLRGTLRAVAAEAAWACSRDRFPALIDLALVDLAGSGTVAEVEALAGSTLVDTRINFDGRPAIDRARSAVALADRLDAKRGFARCRLGSVLLMAGDPEWVGHYQEAVRAASAEGDYRSGVIASEGLVLGQWLAGSVDSATATAEEFFLAGPLPNHRYGWLSNASHAAVVSLAAGNDRAQLIDRWRPLLADEPAYRNREFAEAAVALSLSDLGRHDEAANLLVGAAARPMAKPEDRSLTCWALAETAFLAGRADDAACAIAAADRLGPAVSGFPPVVVTHLVGGYLARDAGEVPTGAEPMASVPGWDAAPLEWRGLVASAEGRYAEAVDHLDAAVTAWRGHDRRCEIRAGWAAADSARLAGMDDAIERLRAVEAQAVRYQVGDVAARCRRTLRMLGVSRGSARSVGGILTARQEQVLRRVGAGLTTGAIATELHIAPSTVDSTVREAVRRLGALNRRAAAAAMLSALDRNEPPTR